MIMNRIHPSALVYEGVEIGDDNYIGPFCVIYPGVVIGDGNVFMSHCSIGAPPQHRACVQDDFLNSEFITFIGDSNIFREFVTVHRGYERSTMVASSCMLMSYAHVSHDTLIGDDVVMANNVQIGGHSCVMKSANIGLSSVIHQFSLVGAGAMLGMGAIVTKSTVIKPFGKYVGSPAKFIGSNDYVINKIQPSLLEQLIDDYSQLSDSGYYRNIGE